MLKNAQASRSEIRRAVGPLSAMARKLGTAGRTLPNLLAIRQRKKHLKRLQKRAHIEQTPVECGRRSFGTPRGQHMEVVMACEVLNRMSSLGLPDTVMTLSLMPRAWGRPSARTRIVHQRRAPQRMPIRGFAA